MGSSWDTADVQTTAKALLACSHADSHESHIVTFGKWGGLAGGAGRSESRCHNLPRPVMILMGLSSALNLEQELRGSPNHPGIIYVFYYSVGIQIIGSRGKSP